MGIDALRILYYISRELKSPISVLLKALATSLIKGYYKHVHAKTGIPNTRSFTCHNQIRYMHQYINKQQVVKTEHVKVVADVRNASSEKNGTGIMAQNNAYLNISCITYQIPIGETQVDHERPSNNEKVEQEKLEQFPFTAEQHAYNERYTVINL